jgi:hypothetical protein
LLIFGGGDGPQQVGNGGVLRVKLGIGVVIFGEALAPGLAPAVAVMTGDPPPSRGSV